MTDHWIMNASPVILLSRVGLIDLVPSLCRRLSIPSGVIAEVSRGSAADAGRAWLQSSGSRFIVSVPTLAPEMAGWDGGPGEAEVISYALQQGNSTVVLDDLAARRRARSLGLPLIGSVGVILRAKELRLVPQARSFLEKLRGGGGYVSENIIQQALKKADEL